MHDGCECCCGKENCIKHNIKEERETFWDRYKFDLIKLSLSTIILIVCLICGFGSLVTLILSICAMVISGYRVVIECIENIFHGEILDENTLMLIASVVAVILGQYTDGVAVIILFQLGELLEDIATNNSRNRIAGLSSLKVHTAKIVEEKGIKSVSVEEVAIGSLIEVLTGEAVPIDGILVDSACELDTKAVTGESKLYTLNCGDNVYSGSINVGKPFIMKTTKLYKDSTVEKIISLVEGATAKKAKSQKFITSFAKVYTPIVVLLALCVAFLPPLIGGLELSVWVNKALNFLVVSCPCALVISIPLGYFTGVGSLAKLGVLIKGSTYIDALSKVSCAVFDKTGTITRGNPSVSKINGENEGEVIQVAVAVEKHSNHPIAKAICQYCKSEINVSDVKEIAGLGMSAIYNGKEVYVGNEKLVKDCENFIKTNSNKTCVYVAVDKRVIGSIELEDEIKESSLEVVKDLKKVGVKNVCMLTGDKREIALEVGNKLSFDNVYYELLPQDKTEKLQQLKGESKGGILFAGDGINDSPSIALSNVGVAMGGLGSEVAIDCADVVIMDDNINKIAMSIRHAKKIRKVVLENIIGSISIKVILMILSLIMDIPLWLAMFGDVGVMLLAVLNSLRCYLIKK